MYFFSAAHQHTTLLTLPDRSMPPIAMEADAVHQGCLLFCELHSRLLAVGRTAIQLLAHAILRLRTRGLRNLGIAQMCYAILGFRECATQSRDCTNSQIARNIYTVIPKTGRSAVFRPSWLFPLSHRTR